MRKRLLLPTGSLFNTVSNPSDTPASIERSSILVHSGPNGNSITFESADGPIEFDEERIQRIVSNHNKKITDLANGYGGIEKMPLGAFPPILDQHEDDSSNRIIGRLGSLLSFEKRSVPGIGDNVSCVLATITFLGKETVDRVIDGRIYHLSIGIDEASDTLEETSAVITPAAAGAMVLKKNQPSYSKTSMENISMNKQLKNHAIRMEKLSSMKESLTTLRGKVTTANTQLKLVRKEGDVSHRLTTLIRSGKLTPAEYKKMDVKKLALLSEDALETVLSTIEAMEPKIIAGQRGSTDSVDFTSIGKSLEKTQKSRLKSETRKDFKRMGKKLLGDEDEDQGGSHEMEGGNKIESVNPGKDEGAIPGQGGDEKQLSHAKHMCEMCHQHLAHHKTLAKHLEAGDIEAAKYHQKEMVDHCKRMAKHMSEFPGAKEGEGEEHKLMHLEYSDVKSEDYKKASDNFQSQLDELNTQMARIAGMVDELMSVEKEEGQELNKEAEPAQKLASEVKEDVVGKKEDEKAFNK